MQTPIRFQIFGNVVSISPLTLVKLCVQVFYTGFMTVTEVGGIVCT